jgi:hypothetical protein
LVGEGAVRACGAADGFFVVVGGGVLVAAVVDGDEEIVVAAMEDDGGAFDGVGVNAGARGEVIAGGIGQEELSGCWVDLVLLDAGPVAAVGEPDGAVGIDEDVGVDGIEVVAALGSDDLAPIDPFVGRVCGIEGRVSDETDDGDLGAESGAGVADVVETVEV